MKPANETKAIGRFYAAVMNAAHFNFALNPVAPREWPPTPAEEKRMNTLTTKYKSAFEDREKALRELREASIDVLWMFLKYKCDASAVYQFIDDASIIRHRSAWHPLPVNAAIANLRLHAFGALSNAYGRLVVRNSGEKWTATLDGMIYPITPQQGTILERLLDAAGAYVPGAELKTSNSPEERPDRIIGNLPGAIRALTNTKTGPGGGTRLTI